jgi:hypothetical protein
VPEQLREPANPTNGLVDLAKCAAIADELAKSQGHRPPVVVDNTMLGPMFQTPLKCGADISLCSLTKYVGGHSDLVGGSISGDANLVKQVLGWRSSIGTQLDPNSCWMLMRSLETLEIRNAAPKADGSVWGHRFRLCRRHQYRRDAKDGGGSALERQGGVDLGRDVRSKKSLPCWAFWKTKVDVRKIGGLSEPSERPGA